MPLYPVTPGPSVVASQALPDIEDPAINFIAEYTRTYMRDYPELNRLTEGYDHSPRHMKWAVIDALSDWASTPPFIGQNLNMILERNLVKMLRQQSHK